MCRLVFTKDLVYAIEFEVRNGCFVLHIFVLIHWFNFFYILEKKRLFYMFITLIIITYFFLVLYFF